MKLLGKYHFLNFEGRAFYIQFSLVNCSVHYCRNITYMNFVPFDFDVAKKEVEGHSI
jgi:hypothetical protein